MKKKILTRYFCYFLLFRLDNWPRNADELLKSVSKIKLCH